MSPKQLILLLRSSILITCYDDNTVFRMKNPLQEAEEIKRLLKSSSRGDFADKNCAHIFAILGNQTMRVPHGDQAEQSAAAAVNAAASWIHRLHRYGITEALAKDLNVYLKNSPSSAWLEFDSNTKTVDWAHGQLLKFDDLRPVDAFAYVFCRVLERGHFKNLKRCAANDCRKYHVRRGKWCDDGCGSRERQRKMRRLKREGQMLC